MFYSQESDSNYPLQSDAAFRHRFAYNMSHSLSDHVVITYADRPYLSGFDYRGAVSLAEKRRNRHRLVVAIIGKCRSHTGRTEFVKELARHIPIDSYGACLNNKPPPVAPPLTPNPSPLATPP